MNADYKEGMRAFDRGEPLDPAQRSQWRRGWAQAAENAEREALDWARHQLAYEGVTFPVDREILKRHLRVLLRLAGKPLT